jgi:hypothetical protein
LLDLFSPGASWLIHDLNNAAMMSMWKITYPQENNSLLEEKSPIGCKNEIPAY